MVLGKGCFSKDVPLCYYEISLQLNCISTVNEDLNLCRFKCVFAYKVTPYFILANTHMCLLYGICIVLNSVPLS